VDPAARPAFYRALPEHDLFVITEGDVPEQSGPVTVTEETPVKLRMIELDGAKHIPVFTSVERISAVVPRTVGFVGMKGRDLLSMLREKSVVLNPGSDYGKFLTPQEIGGIIDGSIFDVQAQPQLAGQKILLGAPADYPHHLVEPLKRFFATRREVKRAYLAHALIEAEGEAPHTMIGIVVSGNWDKLVEEAGLVVRQVTRSDEYVDMVQIRRGDRGTIASYMQQHTQPFYRRKLFGLF
jgi:SseB protein C-terminal domain/SseB protein N-terminal domain